MTGVSSHEFGRGAAVRVIAEGDAEKIYEEKVDDAILTANQHAEELEKAENAIVTEDPTEATLRLVRDAIKSQDVSNMTLLWRQLMAFLFSPPVPLEGPTSWRIVSRGGEQVSDGP